MKNKLFYLTKWLNEERLDKKGADTCEKYFTKIASLLCFVGTFIPGFSIS